MAKERKQQKIRNDAWEIELSDAARRDIYNRLTFSRDGWEAVAEHAVKEYGAKKPGKMTLYRFADRFRAQESDRRLEQVVIAQNEAAALAGTSVRDDEALIEAYKMLAADVALSTGDAEQAGKFVNMALSLAASNTKKKELELKARAQETKEEQLKLAREKFEETKAQLAAVRDAVASAKTGGGLTEETLKKIEEAAGLL